MVIKKKIEKYQNSGQVDLNPNKPLSDVISENKKIIGKLRKSTDTLKRPSFYDIENIAAKEALDYHIDDNVLTGKAKELYFKKNYKEALNHVRGVDIKDTYDFFHDMHTAASPMFNEYGVLGITKKERNNDRAHYIPGKRTLSVDGINDIVAELAHAKQEKDGVNFTTRLIKDWLQDPYITERGADRSYDNVGSLEHEAHSVIEPKLWDIINNKADVYNGIFDIKNNEKGKSFQQGGAIDMKKIKKNKLEKYQAGGETEPSKPGYPNYNDPLTSIFSQGLGASLSMFTNNNPFGNIQDNPFGKSLATGVYNTGKDLSTMPGFQNLNKTWGSWDNESKGIEKGLYDEDIKKYGAKDIAGAAHAWAKETGYPGNPGDILQAYTKNIQDRAGQQYDSTIAAQKQFGEYGKPLMANMAALDELNKMSTLEYTKGLKRDMYDVSNDPRGMESKGIFKGGGHISLSGVEQAGLGGFFKSIGNAVSDWGVGVADSFGNRLGIYDIDNSNYKTGVGKKLAGINDTLQSTTGKIGKAVASAAVPGLGSILGAIPQAAPAQQQQQPTGANPYAAQSNPAGQIDYSAMLPYLMQFLQGPNLSPQNVRFQQGGGVQQFQNSGAANPLQQALGYKDNSPYKELPSQTILRNMSADGVNITMDGVSKDLYLVPDVGRPVKAKGNSGEYYFPKATKVEEIPSMQSGGSTGQTPGPIQKPKRLVIFAESPELDIESPLPSGAPKDVADMHRRYRNLQSRYRAILNSGDTSAREEGPVLKELSEISEKYFYHPYVSKSKDRTFLKVADQYKKWGKKHNVPVEVRSGYGVEDVENGTKDINSEDSFMFLGHSGNIIAGVPLEEWDSIISSKNPKECIGGTCNHANTMVNELPNVKNYYNIKDSGWHGPDMSKIDQDLKAFSFGLRDKSSVGWLDKEPPISTTPSYLQTNPTNIGAIEKYLPSGNLPVVNRIYSQQVGPNPFRSTGAANFQSGGGVIPSFQNSGSPTNEPELQSGKFGGLNFDQKLTHLKVLKDYVQKYGIDALKESPEDFNFFVQAIREAQQPDPATTTPTDPPVEGGDPLDPYEVEIKGKRVEEKKGIEEEQKSKKVNNIAERLRNPYELTTERVTIFDDLLAELNSQKNTLQQEQLYKKRLRDMFSMQQEQQAEQNSQSNIYTGRGRFQQGGQTSFPILNLSGKTNPLRLNPQGMYKFGGLITEGSEYNKRKQPKKNPISGASKTGPMGPKDVPSYDSGIRAIIDQEENEIIPTDNLIPIQTEVGELIILPTGDVVPVMAKKRHHKMDEDEVTDIAPEGAYILSAHGQVRIKKDEADRVITETGIKPYRLGQGQDKPTEKTLAYLMTKKEMSPADVGRIVSQKFPVVATSNPYEAAANTENKINRKPYLEGLIQLSEFDKMRKGIDTSSPEATREYSDSQDEGNEMEMENEEMRNGGNTMQRNNITHAPVPLALLIPALTGLFQAGTSAYGASQQKKDAQRAYADVLRISNQSADKQRSEIGLGAAAGIMGTLGQDPRVNPLVLDPTFIRQMETRTPMQVTDAIANQAYANMPDYRNLPANQQLMGSQAAYAQALKAAGDNRLAAYYQDRGARNQQLTSLQGYEDKNRQERETARRATTLNTNQMLGNVGDRTQGYFDSSAAITANQGQTQTSARLGQSAANQQAIKTYTGAVNSAIGTAGAAAYDYYANRPAPPQNPYTGQATTGSTSWVNPGNVPTSPNATSDGCWKIDMFGNKVFIPGC